MELVFLNAASLAHFVVPLLALWAIVGLYTMKADSGCWVTQAGFFLAMLIIACLTVRTVVCDHGCWLIHTSSLGMMIVAGVMRRPPEYADQKLFS